ncbi:hypothetical protein IWZ00DRAFT_568266 [Phyllosticta capitalensis]
MASNISKREWICWAGDFAREDTSTLVLSAPSSAFVDLRILQPSTPAPSPSPEPNSSQPSQSPTLPRPRSPPLPNTGGPVHRLDWAFAGFSQSFPSNYDIHGVTHKKWVHVIDSRCGYDDEGTRDEGDMWERGGGYSLESGVMKHPNRQVEVAYQEMWKDVAIRTVNNEPLHYAVVLSHHNPKLKSRGMIVRVGQYCQGILMLDREVTVERWECGTEDEAIYPSRGRAIERHFYQPPQGEQSSHSRPPSPLKQVMVPGDVEERAETETAAGTKWRRTVKLGSRFLPCVWTFEGAKLELGDKMMGPGGEEELWEVKEIRAW